MDSQAKAPSQPSLLRRLFLPNLLTLALILCALWLLKCSPWSMTPKEQSAKRTLFRTSLETVRGIAEYLIEHDAEIELKSQIEGGMPFKLRITDLPADLPNQKQGGHIVSPHQIKWAQLILHEGSLFVVYPGFDGEIEFPRKRKLYNPFDRITQTDGDVYVELAVEAGKLTLRDPYPSLHEMYDSVR